MNDAIDDAMERIDGPIPVRFVRDADGVRAAAYPDRDGVFRFDAGESATIPNERGTVGPDRVVVDAADVPYRVVVDRDAIEPADDADEPGWAPAPNAGTLVDESGAVAFADAGWATRAIAERVADVVRQTTYGARFRFSIPDGVAPSDVGGRVADDLQADVERWDVAWTDGAVFVRVPHRIR